ncbi:MAG: hypothetical protein PHF00_10620 [Elusimicrobia bacterium]|nr:hypothetical protein [Elusimicrobiota bacterium]
MDAPTFQSLLKRVEVLRAPKRALATFGATTMPYHLVSPVEELENRARLRRGRVVSRRPQILTPDSLAKRWQGFGRQSSQFAELLSEAYRDLLRALEYNFKNEDLRTRVLSSSAKEVCERIVADLEARGDRDEAVVRCPDGAWGLALMKLTLDEAARAFPVNVRDLERRGLFDPAGHEAARRRREIEELLARARRDRSVLEPLGRKLRQYGLFEEYEDKFLAFF